eukprot:8757420-Pyramimonas_sp.AAC.1
MTASAKACGEMRKRRICLAASKGGAAAFLMGTPKSGRAAGMGVIRSETRRLRGPPNQVRRTGACATCEGP